MDEERKDGIRQKDPMFGGFVVVVQFMRACKHTLVQVEQYQNFSISYEGEDYSKSRAAAAGENIADNGGGMAVYETYERLPEAEKQCVPGFNFTSDQLFWVESF